ncbi:MAG: ABC transporter ATP-binding protein/permease [Lachnospiraceae bacterium]|nr:ABC transporter ATP-binding protein/permease [Lachnospiraceae bacterium]
MNDGKLTSKLTEELKADRIDPQDILCFSPADLSFDCAFIDGTVFLTEEILGVCTRTLPADTLLYFRGTKQQNEERDEGGEYETRLYELKKLGDVRLERHIGANILSAEYDGERVRLCALTNTCMDSMQTLLRVLKDIRRGKPAEAEAEAKDAEEEELYCPICGTMYPDPKKKLCPKCTNKRTIFARTLKYFFRYRLSIVFLIFCYILSALISIAWPYLSGKMLYDHVLERDEVLLSRFGLSGRYVLALTLLVLLMFGCRLISHVTDAVQMALMANIATKTVRDIKSDVFSAMSRLSLNFFTNKQTGGLMTRVISDANRVTEFFIDGLPSIFIQGMTIIITFVVMYRLNWQMALIACILLPLLVFMTVKLRPGLWNLSGKRHRAEKAVSGKANDNLNGARVVKAFGQQDAELKRFEKPNRHLEEAEVNIVKLRNRFTILYNLVQEVSSIWIWIIGVFFVLKTEKIELGVLLTFVGYVGQLNGPMNFFSRVFRMWSESINAAQRLFEIIDSIPDVQESADPVALPRPRGEIVLEHVTFGYSRNKPVLKDINLRVREGEVLGIVGRSGAGKSTLVNLISRLYDVQEGTIRMDGIDVKELAFSDLRRNVAMVSQDTYIFMGSVAMNIAYGREDASRADIIRAAKLAGAHDFISRMPDGYDTVIGSAGKDLSGGEKQRISIARAILADPKILILDEATASVDTQTEKAIQNSLRFLEKGRTTLSIAHRLSTLRDADRLIVIEKGRIVEEGTAEELDLIEDGIYHKLSRMQVTAVPAEEQ